MVSLCYSFMGFLPDDVAFLLSIFLSDSLSGENFWFNTANDFTFNLSFPHL